MVLSVAVVVDRLKNPHEVSERLGDKVMAAAGAFTAV